MSNQPDNPEQPPRSGDDAAAGPVSGQPLSSPPSGPLADSPRPQFQPGKASLPQPAAEPEPWSYPPTSQFPQGPDRGEAAGYGPPPGYGTGQPGYGPPPRPPKKSNVPLIAVILAVAVLLCGGAATAGVLVVNYVKDRATEALEPITNPTLPTLPTDVPDLPTEIPDLPTDIPDLPTDLPTLPTEFPGLPGNGGNGGNGGKKITVIYEVTGDGPAEIVYTEKLGETPKRVSDADLPWTFTTTMEGSALIAVSALRSGTDSGEISCRATVDGKEVVQKTREGSFASATCTKMVLN